MTVDDRSEGSSEGGSSSRSSSSAATSSSSRRRSSSFSYRNSFCGEGLAWLGVAGVPNVRSKVGLYISDGDRLRTDFHALYRIVDEKKKIRDRRKILRKFEVMKHMRDRRKKVADIKNGALPGAATNIVSGTSGVAPCIEIDSNPSSFATYAHVRSVVLHDAARQAQGIYLASNQLSHSDSDTDDDSSDSAKDAVLNLPKMVGVGLVSVYELIHGSVSAYPALCIRALEALLDILQGQQPEALRNEPAHVIDALFQLLLRLSTSSTGSSAGEVLSWPAASPLTGVACACLLALVVARGDSAMFLRAVTDILITSRHLATQTIQVPVILTYLQRSVHALLLGRLTRPDWFSSGVPHTACIDTFPVQMMTDGGSGDSCTAITCDGHYLYLHNTHGMFKVGTGFGGTRKGHVYLHRPDCFPRQTGWLGFANGDVYYRPEGSSRELMMLDRETLKISEVHQTSGFGWTRGAPFSDGQYIGYILPDRDDGFVVRSYNPVVKPIPLVNELNLSLAVRCVQVFGNGDGLRDLGSGLDEDVLCVAAGKDFTIMCNSAGRLYYSGKPASVGLKGSSNLVSSAGVNNMSVAAAAAAVVNNVVPSMVGEAGENLARRLAGVDQSCRQSQAGDAGFTSVTTKNVQKVSRWPELVVSKWPSIVMVCVGHEGHHAVLLADDGAAYFVGTARRGEDADTGKMRRQPKAVKPKRMSKMEGHHVVSAACNHATSALVTKEGELFMFGKDTTHADPATGLVSELHGIHVQSVALGKAHAAALTTKGLVYTFGINNKGQCGRDFTSSSHGKEPGPATHSNDVSTDDDREDRKNNDNFTAQLDHGKCRKKIRSKHKSDKSKFNESEELEGMSSMAVAGDDDADEEECIGDSDDGIDGTTDGAIGRGGTEGGGAGGGLCPRGRHRFYRDHCMVCYYCHECTGYGASCVSSSRPNRMPGQACGCGSGESGCSECGCCRTCAEDAVAEGDMSGVAGLINLGLYNMHHAEDAREGDDEGDPEAVTSGAGGPINIFGQPCGRLQQELHRRLEETRNRHHKRHQLALQQHRQLQQALLAPAEQKKPDEGVDDGGVGVTIPGSTPSLLTLGSVGSDAGSVAGGSGGERDGSGKMCSLPPAQLVMPTASPVLQVACGQHHTVALCSNGDVYSWGSNSHGQLGTGDLLFHPTPQLLRLPPTVRVSKVAAGSNHTVLLTNAGQIYTCGSHQRGQLGRLPLLPEVGEAGSSTRGGPRAPWWSFPGLVPGIGPRLGRKATWVGASADTTFIKLDQSLINAHNLSAAAVVANATSLVLLPVGERTKVDSSSLGPVGGASSSSSSSSPSHSTTSTRTRCASFTSARYRTTESGTVEERSSSFSGALANKRSGFIDISGSNFAAAGGSGFGGAFGSGGSVVGIGSSGSLCGARGDGGGSSSNSSVAAVAGSGGGSNSSIGSGGTRDGTTGAAGAGHKTAAEEGGWRVLVINRLDGRCRSFSSSDQILCRGHAVCLDPIYNVLWSFDPERQSIKCYNLIACEAMRLDTSSPASPTSTSPSFMSSVPSSVAAAATKYNRNNSSGYDDGGLRDVLSPELSLPVLPEVQVSRAQASCTEQPDRLIRTCSQVGPVTNIALHLLSCLDTLTWGYQQGLSISEEDAVVTATTGVYTKDDFTPVTRFHSHGGGWGYSGHSVEAVRFMCDTDVLLGGYGLFGGRGEYVGKIKLYDIGYEGGEQEQEGELLTETEEMPYECPARQKFPILFEEPVPLQARRWYVAWARVTGPSSDCGSSGQSLVTTEEQVMFYFKSSKKSNNGTDVNAGQIPQLLYRIISPEGGTQASPASSNEPPVPILSKAFFTAVSNDVFQSLLDLMGWAWSTLRTCVGEVGSGDGGIECDTGTGVAMLDLHRLVYICRACLRLLHLYVTQLYPNTARGPRNSNGVSEKSSLVESVSDVRGLLRQMLSDPLPATYQPQRRSKHRGRGDRNPLTRLIVSVLEECHRTFVLCFHAFYPTGHLKWACLCDLLVSRDQAGDEGGECDRLLSAVLAALVSPNVKLRTTFPMLTEQEPDSSYTRPSPADNAALSTLQPGDLRYPLLVEHMTYKTQMSGGGFGCVWTFREVLERLLGVVCGGVRGALRGDRNLPLPPLVHNTCLLVAAAVAELAEETTHTENDACGSSGRVLHVTPTRFSRTSHSRSWSTGNGSPDAICFSVDRHGILIAGMCLYAGAGTYDYELELMDETASEQDVLPAAGGAATSNERWVTLEIARGSFGPDDSVNDIAQVKFDKPVPIRECVKYAFRLVNRGGRTTNGDFGQSSVKGPDGTIFCFSACSLSVNGTNHIRGQMPQILYYSTSQDCSTIEVTRALGAQQARSAVLSVVGSVVRSAAELCIMGLGVGDDAAIRVLASSPIITVLLPLLLSHVTTVALSDPRSAVSVLGLCQELVPHVAALNNLSLATQTTELAETLQGCHSTTSTHYATVESDHPYKPATVVCYRVSFPSSVQWMSLDFDPQSNLTQPEDTLLVLIPNLTRGSTNTGSGNPVGSRSHATVNCSARRFGKDCQGKNSLGSKKPSVPAAGGIVNVVASPSSTLDADDSTSEELPYWTVLPRINSVNKFPDRTVIVPGNELVFSMETASDYLKEERVSDSKYGFSARVVGYEWPPMPSDAIRHLEKELSYLGGLCAASLIKKELKLPPVGGEEFEEEVEGAEDVGLAVLKAHPVLLSKGFALSHPPTIHHTLDGVIPFSCHSNERLFLRDLVSCSAGTSGGRLARWLQPDAYVDVRHTEVIYSRDDLRSGWPAIVTIITRDQYGEVVFAPSLRIEVVSVPAAESGQKSKLPRRLSQNIPDNMTFGGHPQPCLDTPYAITIREKMCYCAITMMKAYEKYSFEELRYMSPTLQRPTEHMLVRSNGDGSYTCNWTPAAAGCYSLHITIDGYVVDNKPYKLDVKEPPQGMVPPVQSSLKKATQPPSRVRKFDLSHSAGLRVRTHPSLQSEQIGIVPCNGTIAFVDEVHNSDGVWLRLNNECVHQYCSGGSGSGVGVTSSSNKLRCNEAWVLQYNQHLGKTLLVAVEEPRSLLDQVMNDPLNKRREVLGGPATTGVSLLDPALSMCSPDGILHPYGSPGAIPRRGSGSSRIEVYTVVKCGASGHNIRSQPSLRAPPVGMLVQGNRVTADCQMNNSEGMWVRLDVDSTRKYCFTDGEAWSLAESRGHMLYLQWQGAYHNGQDATTREANSSGGFNFGHIDTSPKPLSSFLSRTGHSQPSRPFIFGAPGISMMRGRGDGSAAEGSEAFSSAVTEGQGADVKMAEERHGVNSKAVPGSDIKDGMGSCKFRALNRWLREEANKQLITTTDVSTPNTKHEQHLTTSLTVRGDLPQELQNVSVRELVKAIGESRANGNGTTPPRTPPPTPRKIPRSRSASPRTAAVALSSTASAVGAGSVPVVLPSLTLAAGVSEDVRGTAQHSYPEAVEKCRRLSGSSSPIPIPGRSRVENNSVASNGVVSVSPIGSVTTNGDVSVGVGLAPVTGAPATNLLTATVADSLSGGAAVLPTIAAGDFDVATPCLLSKSALSFGGGDVAYDAASDTSALVSSLTQDMSQSVASGLSSLATSTPNTPRKETNHKSTRQVTQSATQTSPDTQPKFSIGSNGTADEPARISPKTSRKDRSLKQSRSKRERTSSPSLSCYSDSSSGVRERVKEAMSPSVAECMRAIFAAFLWHEGIVHDAMACASFLKFHPDLTKMAAFQWKPDLKERSKPQVKLTKEQKARQRHSVEVSACNYLNVTPQNTEDFLRPGLSSTNMNEMTRSGEGPEQSGLKRDDELVASWIGYQSSPSQKLATVMEGGCTGDVPDLPLVLRHVVLLWEELSNSCMKAVIQQLVLPSPTMPVRSKKSERAKDRSDRERKHKHKKKSLSMQSLNNELREEELMQPQGFTINCDLCMKLISPQNSENHFYLDHPGCGASSRGCGYVAGRWKFFPNKDHFDQACGMIISGCYHLCWNCRHKYKSDNGLKSNREYKESSSRKLKRKAAAAAAAAAASSSKLASPMSNVETHLIMRNNAMFLLDLASAAATPSLPQRPHRRSPCTAAGGSELSPDNSPFPLVPFQCLHTLNCQQQHLNQLREDLLHQTLQQGSVGMAPADRQNANPSAPVDVTGSRESSVLSARDNSYSPSNVSQQQDSSGSDSDIPRPPSSRPLNRSISVTVGTASGQDWGTVATAAAAAVERDQEVMDPSACSIGLSKMTGSTSSLMQAGPPSTSSSNATVVLRKRNNSSGENQTLSSSGGAYSSCCSTAGGAVGSSSLLARPSTWLERLAAGIERGSSVLTSSAATVVATNSNTNLSDSTNSSSSSKSHSVISRPVMAFIFQHHDLETLAYAMRHATRKAAARVYGMQALNWLLRSVTQPTCLHDLLWGFVSALTPQHAPAAFTPQLNTEDARQPDHQNNRHINIIDMSESDMVVLEHPLHDVTLAGDAVHPLPVTFHQLLQTIADLMMLLPPGEPLQMMAVRCFGLRFTPADHDFLHQSHVFSNISKILSLSEEVLGAGDEATSVYEATHAPVTGVVERLLDLTAECELHTSSRQAMIGSLSDYSTETFWESGDEDRNRTKTITITWLPSVRPAVVYVHIDNVRDLGSRVTCVVFRSCKGDETSLVRQLELDSRFTGWLHMVLEGHGDDNCVIIELKGPDQCVRVRQVRVLGGDSAPSSTAADGNASVPAGTSAASVAGGSAPDTVQTIRGKLVKQKTALVLQHRECEQETLKVFRLITGQVFGKLIRSSEGALSNSGDRQMTAGGGAGVARGGETVSDVETGIVGMAAASVVEASEDPERNNDLREHVVGILFSRSKLTHLQKQVCTHIVQAIKKEGVRAREEWESTLLVVSQHSWNNSNISNHNKSPSDDNSSVQAASGLLSPNPKHSLPDTYCFEMLSMVLALSGSAVGRTHLAHQDSLLRHLLALLHTGSARVQRQVVSLFRRILADISPRSLATLLCVESLPDQNFPALHPPTPSPDTATEFDMHKQGILDVFLAVIAKALTVQLKQKGSNKQGLMSGLDPPLPANSSKLSLSSATLAACLPVPERNSSRWWLQGTATQKLADLIIGLIRDMTHGKISDTWARVSKGAIAESIVNLTRLGEQHRCSLQNCLATPTLWLALASLCVLHPDHVEALSSTAATVAKTHQRENSDGSGAIPAAEVSRPTCENHDDGETIALVQCDECGQLCGECDKVLHLHRRRRLHHRTILRHQQQAIKVDLHEGCGRTKLFWLLALADSTTLKALLELRSDGSSSGSGGRCDREGNSECRFCGSPAQTSLLSPTPVCSHPDCQEYSKEACTVVHECGHVCGGIRGEDTCLPCLLGCSPMPLLRQDADDMCMICFSEALSAAPAIQLECGHVFHAHCCKTVLSKRWPGPRISFAFSLCPICKMPIKHWSLEAALASIQLLFDDVRRKALMRLEYEGVGKPEASAAAAAKNNQDLATYAMERYAYYVCYKCKKAYYGGEARCDAEAGLGDEYDPTELVCGACSDVSRAQMCPKHGTDFLEYKCRYCCSVAVFFCFGTTHFCNACHDDFQRVTNIGKSNLPHCPAGPRGVQMVGAECPLHVQHPDTGEEFALGCGVCRNAHTF